MNFCTVKFHQKRTDSNSNSRALGFALLSRPNREIRHTIPHMMNMKSFYSLIFCILLASFAAEGQGWERIYSSLNPTRDAEIKKILPVSDGFLLLVPRSYPISFVDNPDFQIVKVNENGSVVWTRTYDFGQEELAQDMIATSDGGYAVLYTVFQSDAAFSYWLKLDAQFDTVFTRQVDYNGSSADVQAEKITEQNGSIWVFGDKADPASGLELCFIKGYDLNGNALQENEWGEPFAMFRDMEHPGGGDFVAVSDGQPQPGVKGKIFMHRYSQTGSTLIWEQEFGNPQATFYANDICVSPDGGYLIAGAENSSGLLIKTDASGNLVWQKVYPSSIPGDSINIFLGIFNIAPTSDGTGYWAVSGTNSYIPQLVLIRLDLQGNILWHKPFGPYFTYTFGRDLLAMPDGGCVIGGSFHRSVQDAVVWPYLVKTNSAGQTFFSGVAGSTNYDINGDCVAEPDTTTTGYRAYALKNGIAITSTALNQQGEYFLALDTGTYKITVEQPGNAWVTCGAPDTIDVTVIANDTISNTDFLWSYQPQPIDSVFGYAFHDLDGDCLRDSFETQGYEGWPVYLYIYRNGMVIVADTVLTGPNGYYVFDELTGATNEMYANLIIPGPPLGSGLLCHFVNCPQEEVFGFPSGLSHQSNFAFDCDSLPPCPLIEVDIATNVIRPCSTSIYQVHYCNIGVEPASDAYIEVTFDAGLDVTASSIPWSSANGNTYTFELGYLTSGQCGDFDITVLASCDDPNGTTYCAEAHAFPDTCSLPPGPNWDGSQIEVTAECTGDSVVFTIQNVGAGDMQNPLEYIVIEDNVLLMQGDFELEAGEQTQIAYEATGSFFHLAAGQAPGFPGLNLPVAWVEGCGNSGNASLGFVNQYTLGDEDVWLDVFCLESVNSYDPNDKNGFPRGYADEHFIEQNVDIEYLIRFQNTGTAPAYQVEIRDTLPVKWLDPATVRPGASSHEYVWDMQGNGVVVFRFPGIVLPDSAANFDASQGFVKFRVSQRKDVPLGTKIENTAAIFFDFNPPIITNQTLHTVSKNFILTKTDGPKTPNLEVKIVPNPARGQVRVQIAGLENEGENLTFVLYSAVGQSVLNRNFSGANFEFQAGQLPEGVYFYEIRREGKLAATGKLIRL